MSTANSVVRVTESRPDLSFIEIHPGDWVVLKPNLVKEGKETDLDDWRCVVTSPELIRQVCEYVCERLGGDGRVTICDAPQTDSSFSLIAERLGLVELAAEMHTKFGVEVSVVDLRGEEWVNREGVIVERRRLGGDPEGAVRFDLGQMSFFFGHPGEGRYYGADYDSAVVNEHHRGDTQEYLVCATPIKADVFINMPKMKTHKKTGVTLNLKNLVGINADKNWLPHHTEGSPRDGGDEFPSLSILRRLEQRSVKLARSLALRVPVLGPMIARRLRRLGTSIFGAGDQVVRSGNWYGNDTTWRMVLDLNRCLLYGNPDGTLRIDGRKRYYSVVDGVVGMDGMGPMQGDAVKSGVIITGSDPAATDVVTARVMGFDWRKIPMLREAFGLHDLPVATVRVEDIRVESDIEGWSGRFLDLEEKEFLSFRPHFGWIGHIEFDGRA